MGGFSEEMSLIRKVMFECSSKDFSGTCGVFVDENYGFGENKMSVRFLGFFYYGIFVGFDRQERFSFREKSIQNLQDFIHNSARISSQIKDIQLTIFELLHM